MEGIVFDCTKETLEQDGIDTSNLEADPSSIAPKREFKNVYLPPEEVERLKEMYSHSIVQDFDDTYHLSKKEQQELQEKYDKLIKLRKTKKKTRKIDQYVETQRLCMDILEEFAQTNGVYSPEKFKKLVLTGNIFINGLSFPKFQGKERKSINWDYVTEEYIENRDSDPKDLLREENIEVGESFEEEAERYFGSVENLYSLFDDISEEEKIYNSRPIIDPEKEGGKVAIECGKKSRKKLVKMSPIILNEIKKREKLNSKNARIASYNPSSSYLHDTAMDVIEEYDAKRKRGRNQNDYGVPEFTGDMSNKDDVKTYLMRLDEYNRENTFVEYHGKSVSLNDYNDLMIREEMDKNGWDIRKVYFDERENKLMKKQIKHDKKKEKKLKEMLLEIQNRKKGRTEKINGINTKKRKLGKKKKKKVKKKHKKDLKFLDGVITDIHGTNKKAYKKYKEEMEDFKWMK